MADPTVALGVSCTVGRVDSIFSKPMARFFTENNTRRRRFCTPLLVWPKAWGFEPRRGCLLSKTLLGWLVEAAEHGAEAETAEARERLPRRPRWVWTAIDPVSLCGSIGQSVSAR